LNASPRFALRFTTAVLALVVISSAAARASADDFESDRPDLAEGPRTLSTGHVQMEAGWTRSTTDDTRSDAVGEGLVRFGVASRLELRLAIPTWNELHVDQALGLAGHDDGGFGPTGFGGKVTLARDDDSALGVVADVALPGGGGPFHDAHTNLDLVLAGARELGHGELSANVSYLREEGANGVGGVLSYERDWTERLASYGEWAVTDIDESVAHVVDAGVTLRVAPVTQLDARIGFGAGDASGLLLFGAGITQRW
jgi:hypothetical protein